MSRRKYEPAGGVVPLEWHEGEPGNLYGPIIAELWDASWHWSDFTLDVRASLRMLKPKDGIWFDIGNDRPLDAGRKFRRWCHLSTTTTNVSLTLEDWPR